MTCSINRSEVKVLLDNGIISHAEFAEPATKTREILWSSHKIPDTIHGFVRKHPHENDEYQKQINAIFTIGRLIREGKSWPTFQMKYDLSQLGADVQLKNFMH